MNHIIPHFTAEEHFGNGCKFWNSRDDWFLERDQMKVHLFNGSLRLVEIDEAMRPGKVCEEFTFNWNWHAGTPPGLHALLRRYDYDMRAVFNHLRSLPWARRKHHATGEVLNDWQEFKLPQIISLLPDFGQLTGEPGASVELYRSEERAGRIWSPFASVNPLAERPKKWTIPHVVRALLSGQFSNLKCDGVYTDDYAFDNAANYQKGEIKHAAAFARRILESPSGWWASERAGEVSICCHHFDSNSFQFEIMKRFNPLKPTLAVVPLPDGDVAITAVVADAPKKPARAERKSPVRVTVTEITLTVNAERELVELRFPGKPDDATRAEMKAARWRWFGGAACWYHKHTPENLQWAQAFVARHTPCAPSETPPDPEAALRKIWNDQGVAAEKQEAILADITAKAQPGAMVGPFPIPTNIIPLPVRAPALPAWRQRLMR